MLVAGWGATFKEYGYDPAFPQRVQSLIRQFKYPLDTNFARIDRIGHPGLKAPKTQSMGTTYAGHTIQEWADKRVAAEKDELTSEGLRDLMQLGK